MRIDWTESDRTYTYIQSRTMVNGEGYVRGGEGQAKGENEKIIH